MTRILIKYYLTWKNQSKQPPLKKPFHHTPPIFFHTLPTVKKTLVEPKLGEALLKGMGQYN
jgi:hypothetical protein